MDAKKTALETRGGGEGGKGTYRKKGNLKTGNRKKRNTRSLPRNNGGERGQPGKKQPTHPKEPRKTNHGKKKKTRS